MYYIQCQKTQGVLMLNFTTYMSSSRTFSRELSDRKCDPSTLIYLALFRATNTRITCKPVIYIKMQLCDISQLL